MERSEHQTELGPALVAAYRATRYRVFTPTPFELRVDLHSAQLDKLLHAAAVEGAAFVTAWNPRGENHALESNQKRQEALRETLRGRGLRFVEGFGAHADDERRGEESLLVLGLDRTEAWSLGQDLDQNAILWSGRDAVPRLILLR